MPTPESFVLPVINPRPAKRLPYFKEHPTPGPGRGKGTRNKIPYDLKRDLVEAAAEVGFDGEGTQGLRGYLKFLAVRHPKAFSHMLGKVLPLQITSDAPIGSQTLSVNIISVPTDTYLSAEDMARMRGEPMRTVEHVPPSEPIVPKEIEAPSQRDEAKLIAALESLSVETLERLAASLVDQG